MRFKQDQVFQLEINVLIDKRCTKRGQACQTKASDSIRIKHAKQNQVR